MLPLAPAEDPFGWMHYAKGNPFFIYIVGILRQNLVFLYLALNIGEVIIVFPLAISLGA
jgi:hypothetical protein